MDNLRIWLVVEPYPSEIYESQLRWLFPIYGNLKRNKPPTRWGSKVLWHEWDRLSDIRSKTNNQINTNVQYMFKSKPQNRWKQWFMLIGRHEVPRMPGMIWSMQCTLKAAGLSFFASTTTSTTTTTISKSSNDDHNNDNNNNNNNGAWLPGIDWVGLLFSVPVNDPFGSDVRIMSSKNKMLDIIYNDNQNNGYQIKWHYQKKKNICQRKCQNNSEW